MTQPNDRHFSEEELLMHLLGEESSAMGNAVAAHLEKCGSCRAVLQEYAQLHKEILGWQIPELPEAVWQARKAQLLDVIRSDAEGIREERFLKSTLRFVRGAWGYALANPLPTLGYVIVAVAFASERTISIFRLDRILPATSEVLAILRQVL